TWGKSQAPTNATATKAAMLAMATPIGRLPGLATASRTIDRPTPVASCRTDQPRRACSVERSVVRRRLRVMLTMTTLDDIATHRPSTDAARKGRPIEDITTATSAVVK